MASPAERPASRFDVGTEDLDEAVMVTVSGEVDAATVPAMRAALSQAAALGRTRFIIDLRRVSYLDSLGITALAQAFDLGHKNGAAITTVCGARTAALLQSLGLDAEVAIVESRDQALALVQELPQLGEHSGEPAYRGALRSARELIESGSVPADDEELMRLRLALEELPAAES